MIQKNKNIGKLSLRKYIIAAGIVLLLIIPVLIFILLPHNPKPDPASEKIIREVAAKQLNKDPNELTDEDFAEITKFILAEDDPSKLPLKIFLPIELSGIKTLEKFTNLNMLGMNRICYSKNAIPKWMKVLSKLGIVDLSERLTLDLSPLGKINTLEQLYIVDTPVKDIKSLGNLVNLKLLYLQNSQIVNLKPLKKLVNLKEINLSRNPIYNLDPLKGLKDLETLDIRRCPNITDEQIEELKKLCQILRLSDNQAFCFCLFPFYFLLSKLIRTRF